jgi:hypothetical protein
MTRWLVWRVYLCKTHYIFSEPLVSLAKFVLISSFLGYLLCFLLSSFYINEQTSLCFLSFCLKMDLEIGSWGIY